MERAVFRCDAGLGAARRSLLLALPGFVLLPDLARAEAGETSLVSLAATDGSGSALARSLAQATVSVRGYLAPSLDGREFALTEKSAAACQLCGALHDVGASLAVFTDAPDPDAPVLQRVRVSGRLEVDATGGVRLVSARIQSA